MKFGPIRFGSGATWLQHWGNGSSTKSTLIVLNGLTHTLQFENWAAWLEG